jgi:micrococcal nuclease
VGPCHPPQVGDAAVDGEELGTLLAYLVMAAAAAGGVLTAVPSASAVQLSGTVSDVVDGDTIKVVSRGFETPVRLIGIDTPETRHPDKPVQCFGPAASARAKRLLPIGQRVTLVTDPTQDTRDRYGRLLAYVYRPGRSGPRGSVNFALVATGYAKVYVYGGVRFRHADAFFRAQSRARAAKTGLWGPPCRGNTTKPDPSVRAPTSAPPAALPGGACDPNYAGACIPVHPPDIDCGDIPDRNFHVVGTDVHGFDADHNGIACEE